MMRRFDSDLDYCAALNGEDTIEPNAICEDCHVAFSKGEHDPGPSLCDICSDRRDAHTSALEIRMAKADLKADTTRKEVA